MANKSDIRKRRSGTSGGGQVRIIAGKWRGTKLPVIDSGGLRPSGDRVRETLFNWLQMAIPGSHCLDMFAGAGALGLEAASRGAASVTMIEQSAAAAASLKSVLARLDSDNAVQVVQTDVLAFMRSNPTSFDVVFIDPPFAAQLHAVAIDAVSGHLARGAMVYVEAPVDANLPTQIPPHLVLHRQRDFGDVSAYLYKLA